MDPDSAPLLRSDSNGLDEYSQSKISGWQKFGQTIRSSCKCITVEVVIILYFTYYSGSVPLVEQFLYTKVAKSMNYTGPLPGSKNENGSLERCKHPNETDPILQSQKQLQAESAKWMLYTSVAYMITALPATVLMGGYSDKGGRKIVMLAPLVGSLIKTSLYIVIAYFELDIWLLIVGAVIEGCFGGTAVLSLACFSYVTDISNHKNRSVRIIILEVCISVGTVISTLSIGVCIQFLGYCWPFVITALIIMINILYVVIRINETVVRDESVSFITLHNFKNAAAVLLKFDGSNRRSRLSLCLIVIAIVSTIIFGKINVAILWLLASPLCWSSLKLGFYSAYSYVIIGIFSILSTKTLQRRLGDMNLGALGCLSLAISQIVFSIVHNDLMAWLAPLVGCLAGVIIGLMRSFMSKLVKPDETGAMFSSVAIVELVGALLGRIIFNAVYSVSLHPAWLQGLSFWIMAVMSILAALVTRIQMCLEPAGPSELLVNDSQHEDE